MWISKYVYLDEAVSIVGARTGRDGWRQVRSAWEEEQLRIEAFEPDFQGFRMWRTASALSSIAWNGGAGDLSPEHDVRVVRTDIDRLWPDSGTTSAGASTNTAPVHRVNGGRPAKAFWDDFWIEVCRRVHDRGYPATQAELVEGMMTWLSERGLEDIGLSTVKERISKLYRVADRK
jgi:hypothetical protein